MSILPLQELIAELKDLGSIHRREFEMAIVVVMAGGSEVTQDGIGMSGSAHRGRTDEFPPNDGGEKKGSE